MDWGLTNDSHIAPNIATRILREREHAVDDNLPSTKAKKTQVKKKLTDSPSSRLHAKPPPAPPMAHGPNLPHPNPTMDESSTPRSASGSSTRTRTSNGPLTVEELAAAGPPRPPSRVDEPP